MTSTRQRDRFYIVLLMTLLIALSACSLKATYTPTSTETALPATPSVPTVAIPAVSGDDTPWQKVVQAAKREGQLTLYDGGILMGEPSLMVAKAFRDKYGIRIDYVSGVGADVVERLKVESRMGVTIADAFTSSSTHVLLVKEQGLTAPLLELPELKSKDMWEVSPIAADRDGHAVSQGVTYYFVWVNNRLVRQEDAPRKWRDLLDPRWKDSKIVSTHPGINSGLYLNFVPLLNAKILDIAFLAALGKQKMRVETSTPRQLEVVSRGEAPVVLVAGNSTGNPYVKTGAPLTPLAMDEGTTATAGATIGVMEAGSHPNSARLFVNWLLTTEGQDVVGRARSINSIRKDVPDYSPVPVTPRKIVMSTSADIDQAAVMFKNKAFVDLLMPK